MSILRELVVSIDFDDIDIRKLTKTEDAVDDIEDALERMGREIREATGEFALMEAVADSALEDIEQDANRATRAIDRMGDKFKHIGRSIGGFGLKGSIFAGAFAGTIAAAAPVAAGIGAITAAFGAAGIGAVAFGAVAKSALGKVFDVADEVEKLEEKIADAESVEERTKALKELAGVYKDMSSEQRAALRDLNNFKEFWDDFTKKFEDPVFEAFGSGLQSTKTILTELEPTISNVADTVNDLMDSFNQNLQAPDVQKFFEWLEINAPESLDKFMQTFGNFVAGFGNLLMAFDPFTEDVQSGFLDMSESFREWTAGLDENKSFQEFIAYVQENGPVLLGILGDVFEIVKNLTGGFASFGSAVLDATKAITGFLAEFSKYMGSGAEAVGAFVKDRWQWLKTDVIGIDGSHAAGLENVPRNGYVGELHKDEAILTARQANLLRSNGILQKEGSRPKINLQGQNTSSPTFSPTYHIYANGGNVNEIKEVIRKENERFWLQMTLKQA